ncbi:MAG: hypothetical protein CL930_02395 [Deltaproteobacteria bacterium]|nr:hypothetical protein [Deltaproteobacteria bacterium]
MGRLDDYPARGGYRPCVAFGALVLLLLLALSCAPKPGPGVGSTDGVVPIGPLPAVEALMYTTGHTLPKDDLVAQVALGMNWEEGLSGAAAALAIDETAITLERAQHAAHRAGYPYQVRVVSSGLMEVGEHPNALVRTLNTVRRQGDHIGLVRARSGNADKWVALVASPVDALKPIAREQKVGAKIEIQTSGPSTWMLVSPSGVVTSEQSPGTHILDEQGEWWMEVDGVSETIAAIPLYVGMRTPPGPVFELPGRVIEGPVEAAIEALSLVSEARDAFNVPRLREDGTLETLAQYPLELLLSDKWDRESGHGRLQAAGFIGGPVGQVHCHGHTVAACVDGMLRSGREREYLLNPAFRVGGAAAQVSTDGVTVVMNLASE